MTDLMSARTRYFDVFFRDAMAAGVRQAVVLASGLDSRAYRLSWPAGVTVFEIDQPQVIQFKNATLANLDAQATAELRAVSVDLRHDSDLDRLLIDLRDGGSMTAKGHLRRPWSPRSLNKAVEAWRAALAYGIERRELSRNVADAMKKVPRVHAEMSTYPARCPRRSSSVPLAVDRAAKDAVAP